MSQKTYSVAIIGASRIGSQYDSPDSDSILSHAHAFSAHPQTKLVGIIDVNFERAKEEAIRWDTAPYANLESLCRRNEIPHIIVIATPDETHLALLQEALAVKPELVICEKPLVSTRADAKEVREILSNTKVPVIVNFSRRFDTRIVQLQKELGLDPVITASALYGKGTHHIGSHLFDLLRFLFGELTAAAAHFKIEDYPDDPSYAGSATFEGCEQVEIGVIDGGVASVLEVDMFTKTRRIRIAKRGFVLEIQLISEDTLHKGVRILGPLVRETTKLSEALPELVTHACAVIEGREFPRVSAEDALKTFDACERFAQSYKAL